MELYNATSKKLILCLGNKEDKTPSRTQEVKPKSSVEIIDVIGKISINVVEK